MTESDNIINYNPDVLSCIANLSNDEVFTPPNIVKDMLDMLPQELFESTETKFLDPACKSGVFLREIAKRLLTAQVPNFRSIMEDINKKLKDDIPLTIDDEKFLDNFNSVIYNIFHNQLYGIAITELTSLLSRRSVYCSKYPNCRYSISKFDDVQGNIRFKNIKHRWKNGRCVFCGASESEFGDEKRGDELESHAYEFIHTTRPEEIFNMKFDVIIGNPPYQLSDGGNNASAKPIYNLFVEQAMKLKPRYLVMIIPARWVCGGRGLDDFRKNMLSGGHIRELHDYKNSGDCFPGIRNSGGICYFLYDRSYQSKLCMVIEHDSRGVVSSESRPLDEFGTDIFIRDFMALSIIRKVNILNEDKLADMVFRQKPYGLRTNFVDFDMDGTLKVYTKKKKEGFAYINPDKITSNQDTINHWKVVTSRSTTVPEEDNGQVLRMSQTFVVEPNAVVTESYVMLATFEDRDKAENLYSYVKTKFFRFLCQPTIVSPDVSKRTFIFVPMQDFSKPWTDEELYKKYNLSDDEIAFIESMIRPMDLNSDEND